MPTEPSNWEQETEYFIYETGYMRLRLWHCSLHCHFQVSAQGYKDVIFTNGILSSPSTMLNLQFIWRR